MTTMRDATPGGLPSQATAAGRADVPKRARSWLGVAFAVCMVGWGANQFAPLLLLYRAHLGLSAATVEATFGMYAIGLVPGLLLVGPLSDHIGRRRVLLFALLLSMVAVGVLIGGSRGVGWLFAGRVVMGFASGSAFSAGAAWIKELSTAPYEDTPPGAGARRAGSAMTLGFGLGPLVAGLMAQWAPAPTTVPYLPGLVLAVVAVPLVLRAPETVRRTESAEAGGVWRRLRIRGLGQPRFLWVVLPLAPWVFASAVIAVVYMPGLIAGQVSSDLAIAFAAVVAACGALSGVVAQPLARRFHRPDRPGRPPLLIGGLILVIAGILADAGITALGGLGVGQPILVLVVAVEMGGGYAFCLIFGLAEVQRMARPGDLGGMTAVFQAFTYIGFAAPFALSALNSVASPGVLLLSVAGLAALTLAFTAWQARRTARRA